MAPVISEHAMIPALLTSPRVLPRHYAVAGLGHGDCHRFRFRAPGDPVKQFHGVDHWDADRARQLGQAPDVARGRNVGPDGPDVGYLPLVGEASRRPWKGSDVGYDSVYSSSSLVFRNELSSGTGMSKPLRVIETKQ
jgi:hypothetical protein